VQKIKRPKVCPSITTKVRLVCGNAYITTSFQDNKIFEIFATIGKSGGCVICMLQSLTTAVTLGIRYGVPVEDYIKHLIGCGCPTMSWDDGMKYLSCVDAIGKVLKEQNEKLNKEELEKRND
jgi:ribonucleoside-diphosphate reductase alpha chain